MNQQQEQCKNTEQTNRTRRRTTTTTTTPFWRTRRKISTRELVLRDGRKLRYCVDGPLDSGLPVVFAFHAMFLGGKSMLFRRTHCEYVVVAVHRPGYHGSTPVDLETYSYQEFALDVQEVADFLQIDKFAVVGHSSGGPNALACAALLPQKVVSVGTLASDPEYSHDCEHEHEYCWKMDGCIGTVLPKCLSIVPCLRVSNGMRNDYLLERRPYPFRTESIQQPCLVVAGGADTMVPPPVTQKIHDRLPNSTMEILDKKKHNDLISPDVLDETYRKVLKLGGLLLLSSTNDDDDDDDANVHADAPVADECEC